MSSQKHKNLIFRMEQDSLDTIPFHKKTDCLERFIAPDFPLHLAFHKIISAKDMPSIYTRLHHHEFPEINILMGCELSYRIQLGSEKYVVESPAAIWIPARLKHSANVINGSGYYVCMILATGYSAFGGKNA